MAIFGALALAQSPVAAQVVPIIQLVADLSITKTDGPDPALVGEDLTYTLTATNNGPDPATGVTVTDNLPAGVTFISASAGCTESGGTVTCNLGDLANGTSTTVKIVVRPTNTAPTTISNTASVKGDNIDLTSTNDSDTAQTSINRAPVAANNNYTVNEDATLTVAAPGVLGNDTDADSGDSLTAEVVSGPTRGTLSLNADGSFTYTPDADFNGTDAFVYKAKDGRGGTATATANITVSAVNDAPVAASQTVTTDEDTSKLVTLSATDAENDSLTYKLTSLPAHGKLYDGTQNDEINSADLPFILSGNEVTYASNADYNGDDSFKFVSNDGTANSNEGTVGITVNLVNDAPVNSVPATQNINEDQAKVFSAANGNRISISDPDAGGDDVKVTLSAESGKLSLSGVGGLTFTDGDGTDDATMTFTGTISAINATLEGMSFAPAANYDGPGAKVTITTNDQSHNGTGDAKSDTDSVAFNITALNDDPEAQDDSDTTDEDQTLTVAAADGVLKNDTDVENNQLSAAKVDYPAHGTLALNADGSFEYEPNANFNGTDSFTYKANDGTADSNLATANITVSAVNDAPVAENDTATTDEGGDPASIDVPANDTDVDGDTLTIESNAQLPPGEGSVSCSTSECTFTPDADFNGTTSFEYTISDGNGGTDTATVTVNVAAINDAPVATDGSASMDEDGTPINIDLGALVSDNETSDADLSYTVVSGPTAAEGTLSGSGPSRTFDSADNFNGTVDITYKVNDRGDPDNCGTPGPSCAGAKDSEAKNFTITVNPVNDEPTISNITDKTTDEDVPTDPIPFIVGDVESAPGDLTVAGSSDDQTLVPDTNIEFGGSGENRTVTVTPARDESGTATITVTVNDGAGPGSHSATDMFVLSVRDRTPPDAPTVDLEAASDTGFSDTDNVTRDDTPVFTGRAEAGSEVSVYDGTALLDKVTASAGGDWSFAVPSGAVFGDGEHQIMAKATDAAGNISAASAPLNVVVDQQVPDTIIDSSPANPTNNVTARFEFSSTEGSGTSFECSLDENPFEPCASPREYPDLSDGNYVFEVRAIDAAGNTDPSPARRSWTLDTRAPSVSLTTPAGGALLRGEVELAADASDDLDVEGVEFVVDDAMVGSDRNTPYAFAWGSTVVADGEHTIRAKATDTAGNEVISEARTVRVDNTAPDTIVDFSPNTPTNSSTARFEFSSTETGSSGFECSLNEGSFERCSTPKEYSGLSDGEHVFKVRAVDEAGNTDATPAERIMIVDTVAPKTDISSGPSGVVNSSTARFEFSSEPGTTFECSLDGGPFATCGSSKEYPNLGNGEHTFQVKATDGAGNVGPVANRTWTVDTAAPTVVKALPGRRATVKSRVKAIFSEAMNAGTLTQKGVVKLVKKGSTKAVAAKVTYDPAKKMVILKPERGLVKGATYTATITTAARDLAGNALGANKVWSFRVR